jgi:signal transduction histidine kinase/ActR/RegA family two-component response regulator
MKQSNMGFIKKIVKKPVSTFKTFIIFLIFFSTFILLISFGFLFKHYYTTRNNVNQRLQHQSERIESIFVDAIEYTRHSMSYIGMQIANNNKANDYDFIMKLLSGYRIPDNRIMELSTFAWANNKHRYLVSSNKGLHFDEYLDLSDRDYMPGTISEPFAIHLGKPVYGIYSHKYSIPAGYGIVDKKGDYLGAVVIGFVIDGIERKFDEVINSEGISFALVDQNGSVIASSPQVDIKAIQNSFQSELQKITRGQEGILYNPRLFDDGKNYGSIYYNSLSHYPYTILTIYNKNLERDEIYNMILTHIIVFLALLVVVITLLLSFYKTLVRPIIDLSVVAKKISHGNQDVDFIKHNNSEINQLASSILSIKKFIKNEQLLRQELQIINQDLDRKNSCLRRLTKSINHDLRNYINGIAGLANIIAESDENKVYLAQMIVKQSEVMFDMIKDLLDDEQIEMALTKIDHPEDCDVKKMLEEILFFNQRFIADNKVKIDLEVGEDPLILRCGKRKLRQIFDNLITNAVKYSIKDGVVQIRCKILPIDKMRDVQQLYIEIADNGIGMSDEDIAMALVGNGRNIDKTSLDKPVDSHGIGLPLVKEAIDEIGAKMEIESKKGAGTIVKLWFNLDSTNDFSENLIQPKSNSAKKSSQKVKAKKNNVLTNQKTNNSNHQTTIIIADDEPVNILVLENILKSAKYKVVKANNGKEVLEALDQHDCDLIFMDTEMPVLDGIKTAKKIRDGKIFKNFKNYKTIPIITFSGNVDKQSKIEVMKAGINDYLEKPFSKAQVLDLVDKLLANND